QEAARLLRRALDHNPGDALARTDLAAALRLGGNPEAALTVAGQAHERMPLLPFAVAEQWRAKTTISGGAETAETAGAPLFSRPGPQKPLTIRCSLSAFRTRSSWRRPLPKVRSTPARSITLATSCLPAAATRTRPGCGFRRWARASTTPCSIATWAFTPGASKATESQPRDFTR